MPDNTMVITMTKLVTNHLFLKCKEADMLFFFPNKQFKKIWNSESEMFL